MSDDTDESGFPASMAEIESFGGRAIGYGGSEFVRAGVTKIVSTSYACESAQKRRTDVWRSHRRNCRGLPRKLTIGSLR